MSQSSFCPKSSSLAELYCPLHSYKNTVIKITEWFEIKDVPNWTKKLKKCNLKQRVTPLKIINCRRSMCTLWNVYSIFLSFSIKWRWPILNNRNAQNKLIVQSGKFFFHVSTSNSNGNKWMKFDRLHASVHSRPQL